MNQGFDVLTQHTPSIPELSYYAISGAGTFNIKPKRGLVHTVNILGGTAGAITIYDWYNASGASASGAKIAPTFTPGNVTVPVTVTLDEIFSQGLTITTAAATVINISYI